MQLRLYNSLTRQKEEFKPTNPENVTMYACGPTVYGPAHIGNFRTFVLSDVLYRTLVFLGYETEYVMNITDVGHLVSDADEGEDKMAKGVRREGVSSAWELANKYIGVFLNDSQQMGLLPPHVMPRATEHIQEQIDLIRLLEEKGFTYKISDGIYFDTSKFPTYGQLSDMDYEQIQEGSSVEKNSEKRNPTDFALWKFHTTEGKRDMEWESPWGTGFPGWHLECSAMSLKYLGHCYSNGHIDRSKKAQTIDIHIGGEDHKEIHHPNEIAQSEAATGVIFASIWVHGAFLLINDTKVSKSKNNYVIVQDILDKGINPLALRYFFMTTHYRKQTNFTWAALTSAETSLYKLYAALAKLQSAPTYPDEITLQVFTETIADDLRIPEALALLWSVVDSDLDDPIKLATLFKLDTVFGFDLKQVWMDFQKVPTEIKTKIKEREVFRAQKEYDKADSIRNEILEQGYRIEDTENGPVLIPLQF